MANDGSSNPVPVNSVDKPGVVWPASKAGWICDQAWNLAGWMLVALAIILPFREHTMTLEQFFIYGGPALLLFLLIAENPEAGKANGQNKRSIILWDPIFWPIGLFAATAVVSYFSSMDRPSTGPELRKQLLQFVLVFFLAYNLFRDPMWRPRAFYAIFIAGILAAVYGIITYYTGVAIEAGRALGSMSSYTRSAMYFILWMPLMSSAVLYGGYSARMRVLMLCAILIAWWFVLLTQTRGAMAVILLSMLVLTSLRHWKWIVPLFIVCLLIASSLPSFRDRWTTTRNDLSNPNALLSDRLPLWHIAAEVITDHPLTGIGYGSEIYQQDSVRDIYPMFNYKFQPHAHNFYLQTASEAGILHLAAILAFFAAFLSVAASALRTLWNTHFHLAKAEMRQRLDFVLILGAFAGLSAMLIYGFVGHFHETRIAESLWYLLALAYAAASALLNPSIAAKNGSK